MLIDWYTVVAQVINFAVLVWLLKRFLYQPILRAIDAREQRIADSLAQAEEIQAEAEAQRRIFEERNATFERQRQERLGQMAEEVRDERHRLMEEARRSAEQLRERQVEALRREQERLSLELVRGVREQVLAITRRALSDLAHRDLEAAMTAVFLDRLQALEPAERDRLAGTLSKATEPIRLRTAFPLSREQQQRLEASLSETLGLEPPMQFEVVPEIVGGIELVGDGEKLGWSIEEYLHALQHHLAERLDGEVGAIEPPAADEPDAEPINGGSLS